MFQIQVLDGPIKFDGVDSPYGAVRDGYVDGFTIVLRNQGARIVGQIDVIETRFGFYETHAALDDGYHDRGHGIAMYAAAFDEAQKREIDVRSSLAPTQHARAVWCSRRLRSRYKVSKIGRRYRMLGRL